MTISSPAHSIGMALSLVTATAGRGSASHRCARITAFRCSNLLMTGSSRGSISATPRGFSRSRPKPSDWRRRPARSPPSIPCPKALGSLPVPISRHQPHKQSQNARAKIQNTPRDRIPISKISFLQPHRQMGVVMQDCSNSCTTAARGADGVRQISRYDQRIPFGSNRSAALRMRFARVSEEMSGGLECRWIEHGG